MEIKIDLLTALDDSQERNRKSDEFTPSQTQNPPCEEELDGAGNNALETSNVGDAAQT